MRVLAVGLAVSVAWLFFPGDLSAQEKGKHCHKKGFKAKKREEGKVQAKGGSEIAKEFRRRRCGKGLNREELVKQLLEKCGGDKSALAKQIGEHMKRFHPDGKCTCLAKARMRHNRKWKEAKGTKRDAKKGHCVCSCHKRAHHKKDKPRKCHKGKHKDKEAGGEKGNNGLGNGLDPQPPGQPPQNDGPGTSPGNPGNKGKGKGKKKN